MEDIILPPGRTIIIDTDEMTVLLDGKRAESYVSADSDFFLLNPFENILTNTIEGGSAKADINVIWKDRFL